MSVNKPDRKESRVEFENAYFHVYDDALKLMKNNYGASKELVTEYENYIRIMNAKIFSIINDLGTYIRIANSIYPKYHSELEERRIAQDKAIGLCYDLLTKYQILMKILKVKDDKYVIEIKNIIHEINCLKKWRSSDKRFEYLG